MLFVKTDELQEVVLSHTNPFDPEHGLGKTEDELRAEGYLFEFFEELPRAKHKEGFRSVTYCDGEKFWFAYKEIGEVDLQMVMLRLEETRMKESLRRKEVDEVREKALMLESGQVTMSEAQTRLEGDLSATKSQIIEVNGEVEMTKEKTFVALEKAAALEAETVSLKSTLEEATTKVVAVEEGQASLSEQHQTVVGRLVETSQQLQGLNEEVLVTKENTAMSIEKAEFAEQKAQQVDARLQVTDGKLETQAGEIVAVKNDVTEQKGKLEMTEMTMSESLLEMMMTQMTLMEQQGQLSVHTEDILAQGAVMGMTEQMMAETLINMMMAEMALSETQQNLLSTNTQMVTTKAELENTREQLTQTQAEMAELIMMILEGGMVQ